MIKAIHFSDFHLGVDTVGPRDAETHINGRVLDYLDVLDSMIEYAETNGCDVALFAGDAFHKPNPDIVYMREFAKRMIRLRETCEVVLLIGNHDLPGHAYKSSSLELFETLKVDGIMVGYDYEILDIGVGDRVLQVATVPYPARGRLVDLKESRGLSPEDMGALTADKMCDIIEDLANDLASDQYSVLLGHFSVSTATYGAERLVETMSSEPVIPLSVLKEGPWDYVALGHLHKYQALGKTGVPVVYAGSLERVDFGEEGQPKGFVWIEFDNGETRWEFVEVDARPYKTLYVDVSGSKRMTQSIVNAIHREDWTDAVARIIITIQDGDQTRVRKQRVADALEQAGAYCLHSLSFNVIRDVQATRLGDRPASSYTEEELLSAYFQSVGISGEKKDALIDLAFEIMDEVDSE